MRYSCKGKEFLFPIPTRSCLNGYITWWRSRKFINGWSAWKACRKSTLSRLNDGPSITENHSPSRPDDGPSAIKKKFISKNHNELVTAKSGRILICADQVDVLVCKPSGHETSLCVCKHACTQFHPRHPSGKNFHHFRWLFSHPSIRLNKKMFYTKVVRNLVQIMMINNSHL